MDIHTLNMMSHLNRNIFTLYSLQERSQDFDILLFFWFMNCTSRAFVTDPFARHLGKVCIYLYVICRYCRNHKDGGGGILSVLVFYTKDSINQIKNRFLETFTAQSFPLFLYTGSIKLYIQNHHCAPNSLQDNIITFIFTFNINYSLSYTTPIMPQLAWTNPV